MAAKQTGALNRILSVLENQEVARETFLLSLSDRLLGAAVQPGQFLMLSPPAALDPFLPRPFAVFDAAAESVKVLYRRVGKGTRLLAELGRGDAVRVLGPLGNGYAAPDEGTAVLVLAGGIGFASVHLLLKQLLRNGRAVELLYGVRSGSDLYPLDRFAAPGLSVHLATEDGSAGFRGNVCELFQTRCGGNRNNSSPRRFAYVCGPPAMLRRAAVLLRESGIRSQFSLESRMACGYGVCQGCVVRARGSEDAGQAGYRKVCADGPVFDPEALVVESLE